VTATNWTPSTLPEPPSTRPDWLEESVYAEIQRAHQLASTALARVEGAERHVQAARNDANTAAAHYAEKLLEITQPALDGLGSA